MAGPPILPVGRDEDSDMPPETSGLHAMLDAAEVKMGQGAAREAAAMARSCAKLHPSSFRAARMLSGFLAALGQLPGAVEEGERAVVLKPSDPEVRMHMGGLLMGAGRSREAALHLAHFVGLEPGSASGWRALSSALVGAGRSERALEAVEQAIALDANSSEFRLHRASLLSQRSRYEEALDELATAASQSPDDARIHRMASGLSEVLGELPQALEAAERALALEPDNAEMSAHREHVALLIGAMSHQATSDPAAESRARAWLDRPVRPPRPVRRPLGLGGLLAARWRVIHAVMLREMRTRFGRSRLGYLWAIVEPLTHLLTLGSVFALFNHSPPPVGDSLFLFYLTGLLPFLMFSHVTTEMMSALASNGSVLQLPVVKRTDIVLARGLLNLATEVAVGIVAFSVAALLGEQGMPHDPLVAVQAIMLLWLMGMGIGAMNVVVSEFLPSWETFYNSVLRLMYFASGIYYSPISMPDWARSVLVWNPVLQGIEFFRSGFYSQYHPHWLDVGYLVACSTGCLVVGFLLERAVRRRIRVHA
jgi:ABC-type polysaccharide/polyol phosphate export permease/Flp pilus assembly protein TadD